MLMGRISSKEFQSVLEKLALQSLPPITAFKIKKILKIVTEELKHFDEVQADIVNTYATRDDEGKVKTAPDGKGIFMDLTRKDEWTAQIASLSSIEVDLPKLSLKELGDKLQLTALELMALDGLVDE